MKLPEDFVSRMRQLRQEEAEAFFASYALPARRGLRVNPIKISAADFAAHVPFPVQPVPWAENGFFYPEEIRPAQHPWYRAGLYYLQEPSAMTPADRLPVQPGERVLDLCAAPGGKATQLAGKLFGKQHCFAVQSGEEGRQTEELQAGAGLLVANEISNARAKALLRNLELFGAPGCFVTNERADRLADVFPLFFDKILVDAPCSGEGMFHRQPDVCAHWSLDRVLEFAAVQRRLLEEAVKMLRPGGMLLYSTCTFSVEENEGTVASFLTKHPEMELLEIAPYEGFAQGRADWLDICRVRENYAETAAAQMEKCVRIWPDRMEGEGHFLALMRRKPDSAMPVWQSSGGAPAGYASGTEEKQDRESGKGSQERQDRRAGKGSQERQGAQDRKHSRKRRDRASSRNAYDSTKRTVSSCSAAEACFRQFLDEMGIAMNGGRIDCRRERIYLMPDLPAEVRGLQFLRSGVFLGEVRKERFIPAQPFAMLLGAADCGRGSAVSFSADDPRLIAYLSGQTVIPEAEDFTCAGDFCGTEKDQPEHLVKGWKLVCADGYGLGWAHYANGVLKNKYPVSWRPQSSR